MQADQSQDFQGVEARWNRFLLASAAFVAYESVLIVSFSDYLYRGVSSELGVWLMWAAAALGYLLYGIFSRTPASFFVLGVPILLLAGLDPAVPQGAWGREFLPLYVIWAFASVIFVPAWLVGLLAGDLLPRERGRTRK